MTDERREESERGPKDEGPEGERTVRGKPGTEQAKKAARQRDREGAQTRRASTPPDPDEQTDPTGTEKKLHGPDTPAD